MSLPALLTLTMLTLGACFSLARAQTVRVRCETSSGLTYREVFEYGFVAVQPTFPGGDSQMMEYINRNRRYPKEAYAKGVQGRVACQFIVNADGSLSDVLVLRGVETSLDREAVRLLASMPTWVPGFHNGRPVPVRVVWTVPFRL